VSIVVKKGRVMSKMDSRQTKSSIDPEETGVMFSAGGNARTKSYGRSSSVKRTVQRGRISLVLVIEYPVRHEIWASLSTPICRRPKLM
jgi:hypothetical protein